ncbi:hypothetical protein L914_01503 [Phytophthora nicotianae]|uniref:Uncharacterized protein n=2 Tax=Phytophthora nicotianae TaxID=4792 RepID=V9FWA2_PHYNI|nr:hypothetical protein F443_01592 [Phytophthora nicotianae P1569]ETM55262.1 hypothetical protein L914_01503 [Phytophthora nicotianae]
MARTIQTRSQCYPILLFLQQAKGATFTVDQIGYLGFESDSVEFRLLLMDIAEMDWPGLFSVLCNEEQ